MRHAVTALAAFGAAATLAACSSSGPHPNPSKAIPTVSSSSPSVIQHTTANSVLRVNAGVSVAPGASTVLTPDGGWQISSSPFGSSLTVGSKRYQAPVGYVIVPVAWLFTPPAPVTVGAGAATGPTSPSTVLGLDTAGGKYTLTRSATSAGSVLVTVPVKSATKLSTSVTFDKVVQQVDTAGHRVAGVGLAAVGQYDGLSNTGTGTCPPVASQFSGTGGQFSGTCGLVSISRSAWLSGKGWAGPGQMWVQVTGIVNPGTMSWTDTVAGKKVVTKYTVSGVLTGASLNNNQATSTDRRNSSYVMLFRAPSGTGSLTLKVNEILTGKATTPIKAPMSAPATQQASVVIVSALTFQKQSN